MKSVRGDRSIDERGLRIWAFGFGIESRWCYIEILNLGCCIHSSGLSLQRVIVSFLKVLDSLIVHGVHLEVSLVLVRFAHMIERRNLTYPV